MIKATELRIGNWVEGSGFSEKYQKKIDTNDFCMLLYNFYDPIPLTPEILAKAGFEKLTVVPFYEIDMGNNIGQIRINPDNGVIWLAHHRHCNIMNPASDKRYHVHQLQNLYFALTGEELEITL